MIQVLAGVNGAGKSSIGGSAIRANGQHWYNPDEIARVMMARYPQRDPDDVDAEVWREGLHRLQAAIRDDTDFTFETTLGGNTITDTLWDGILLGVDVRIWYCGLESPELHIERVARGGHDIPEQKIRAHYTSSMRNLCRLTPGLKQLGVYDNSAPLNAQGKPDIRRLLHVIGGVIGGQIVEQDANMPVWAKPVAAICLKRFKRI